MTSIETLEERGPAHAGAPPEISGAMLRELRAVLGMSAVAFSDAIGVYPGTLIRWENEQQPMNNPRLVRLAVIGYLAEAVVSRALWSPFIRSAGRVVQAEEDARAALDAMREEVASLEAAVETLGTARARLVATGLAAAALAESKEAREFLGLKWG